MVRRGVLLIVLASASLLAACAAMPSSAQNSPAALAATTPPQHIVLSVLIATASPVRSTTPTLTPSHVPATITTTPSAGTIQGSVVLASGSCCVGGKAGSTVQIPAAFNATTSNGEVSEMRVRAGGGGCAKTGDLDQIAWEPFVQSKTYEYVGIPINWSGYYLSVQFRDASGAISPIACDDVSVEGMP